MKILIATFILAIATTTTAQQIQFGEMAYGGTGCPAGSPPVLEIERGEGKILFDLILVAEAKKSLTERKKCSVRVPISVAPGFQVGVRINRLTGFLDHSKKVRSTVLAQVGLVGITRPQTLTKEWKTKTSSNFTLHATTTDFIWSGCGRDTMLTLDATATTVLSKTSQHSAMSLNELDFDFNFRRCN